MTDLPQVATIKQFTTAIQSGDSETLLRILSPDAVTRWPQSGERITGALACVNIYANYPGGPPHFRVQRISGEGDRWVAELIGDYPNGERWHMVSMFTFAGEQISQMTDYFGPSFPAPDWRKEWVEMEPIPA